MKLENSFWIRHFLMCNELGNKILYSNRQIENVNFADIYFQLENDRNEQPFRVKTMLNAFWIADSFISDLHQSEKRCVFDELEDLDIPIKRLARLECKTLEKYFVKFCCGAIDFHTKPMPQTELDKIENVEDADPFTIPCGSKEEYLAFGIVKK